MENQTATTAKRPSGKKSSGRGLPIFIAILVVLTLTVAGVIFLVNKYSPSKETADLTEYYFSEAAEDTGNAATFVDHELSTHPSIVSDGGVYINLDLVKDLLNDRFYWEASSELLIYTTPTDVIKVTAGETRYYISNSLQESDLVLVKTEGENVYVQADFLQQYTTFDYAVYTTDDISRVMITSASSDETRAKIKKTTAIRTYESIKATIVSQAEKGTEVTVLTVGDKFTEVITEDGTFGYVKNNALSASYTATAVVENICEEPVYTSLTRDHTIRMCWNMITTRDANDNISALLSDTEGINVLAPTWFYLDSNSGDVASLASADYVTYAHENGIEVWALVSNLTNTDVDTTTVLTNTTSREHLESQLLAYAIEYKLDGINVDFESLSIDAGEGFIEFIRELSILCRKNGLVLSVDNYPPESYNTFYNRTEQAIVADYVILMGYDEHYSGSDAGSVASLPWVEEGVINTLSEVPADKLILGIPFYTRLWTTADGTVSSTAMGMQAAADVLDENDATVTWNETLGQNYAYYTDDDGMHEMWQENGDSIKLKADLITQYDLAGFSAWRLGFETADIWDILSQY